MLVLSRKKRESVIVGGDSGGDRYCKVTVIEIRGGSVKLGFDASADVPVNRSEVWERIRVESQPSDPRQRFERLKGREPYGD